MKPRPSSTKGGGSMNKIGKKQNEAPADGGRPFRKEKVSLPLLFPRFHSLHDRFVR
ncbi:hypothetical protein B4135_4033 [Caldibacillus debilis]|uniref:Uncharacterized protein n=1 Tax=Caldibacillus debilis TaxID=301148 RepID=A0A150L9E5_9BACI|nr:hypothetical protein B4135_4033 [Caldibacillus debilis]